ncbi:MAG TPA: helix-turn-helix domain-containing protein, partial [Candidatus Acidoferrales bacterium]|nr:helix-turn-helix domain-containing protein [Candidatus Acidoferrales bacterium]
ADKVSMLFSKQRNVMLSEAPVFWARSRSTLRFGSIKKTQGSSTPRRSRAAVGMTFLITQVCHQSAAIAQVIAAYHGDRTATAHALNISMSTLWRKMSRYGLMYAESEMA